jgi:ketosteroid isomerase-like protein
VADTAELSDKLAIRERLEAYADAVMRKDADAWGACWAQDCVWNLGGGEMKGRDTIVPIWIKAMASYTFVAFPFVVGKITLEGDRAVVRSFVHEHLYPVEGGPVRQLGQYDDVLIRQGGDWVFQSRAYSRLHRTED